MIRTYKQIEEDVYKAARAELLDCLLTQCTAENHRLFRLMYSPGEPDLPLEQAVEKITPDALSWALEQVRNTIRIKSERLEDEN